MAIIKISNDENEPFLPQTPVTYFVSDGTGHCKIGYASDIFKRLSNMQTANASKLKPIYLVYFETSGEAKCFEETAHRLLSNKKVRGEWFEIESVSNLLDLIHLEALFLFGYRGRTQDLQSSGSRRLYDGLDRLDIIQKAKELEMKVVAANRLTGMFLDSTDVVEITRCQDCEHYTIESGVGVCMISGAPTEKYSYCSKAERKEAI